MDFIDQIKVLATKIPKLSESIKTEEATKNALVLPLLNILGYNVFDPTEVVPEFTTDYGTKKGEKVDPMEKACPECLSMIPIKASRCKFCGTKVE